MNEESDLIEPQEPEEIGDEHVGEDDLELGVGEEGHKKNKEKDKEPDEDTDSLDDLEEEELEEGDEDKYDDDYDQ